MKYIFRYTLLTQYTNNPDSLQPADLVSTLKSVNFNQLDKIQPIIDTCRTAADALIKNMGKSAQSGTDVVKDTLAQVFGQQNEPHLDDLLQVWQAEKQQVMSKILMESTRCQSKLTKFSWQINSEIGAKTKGSKQRTAVVNIISTNADKSSSKTKLQLTKQDLNSLSSVLLSAGQFLDATLK